MASFTYIFSFYNMTTHYDITYSLKTFICSREQKHQLFLYLNTFTSSEHGGRRKNSQELNSKKSNATTENNSLSAVSQRRFELLPAFGLDGGNLNYDCAVRLLEEKLVTDLVEKAFLKHVSKCNILLKHS